MKTTRKGFTLIELLIVIAIIGVLAVAFLPSLLGAPAKGRDATRMAQIQKIENYLVTQVLENKSLPASGCISGDVAVPADGPKSTDALGAWIKYDIADFGGVFPEDPQDTQEFKDGDTKTCKGNYGYIKFDAGIGYTAAVVAEVEEVSNANIKCGDLKSSAKPTLNPGGIKLTGTEEGCFAALIQ